MLTSRKLNRMINLFFYFLMSSLLFAAVVFLTDSEAETIHDINQLEKFDLSKRIAVLSPQVFQRFPYALYTPQDFAFGLVTQPTAWGSGNPSYITYRLVLSNLTEGMVYGLSGLSATHAMTLWVNGVILIQEGVPANSLQNMSPSISYFTVYFTAEAEEAEIVIQRSSFVLHHGGRLNPIYFGEQHIITTLRTLSHVRTSVIIGVTVMAALLFFGMFLFFKNQHHFIWFSLLCLMIAFRTLGIDNRLTETLLPNLNWHISYFAAYVSTSGFIIFTVLYLDAMFQNKTNRVLKLGGITLLILHAVFMMMTPPIVYSRFNTYYNIFLVSFTAAFAGNLVWLAVKYRDKRHIEHILILTGAVANIAFGFAETVLRAATPQAAVNYTQIGTMIFIFVNTIALALYFRNTEAKLSRAKELSRRNKAQKQRLADENAALDRINKLRAEMIQTISHEARTPLAVLASYSSLVVLEMKKKASTDGTGVDTANLHITADLDKIAYEAKRIANLIDRMKNLPLQKEKTTQRAKLDMGSLVVQTAELYRHILDRFGVLLVTNIPDNLPLVFGNPEELTQVVFNLLQNAKNHSEAGGQIIINMNDDNGEVRITVADTGMGIESEILPRIFERGVYGSSGGTGIGLAICKEIVEAHGGRIWIESIADSGTKVTFTLPVYRLEV
ncbi:MAG: sensor histidine kinase [Treponema sp.]|nr:sensor histidine kinase [Treponema sp.]